MYRYPHFPSLSLLSQSMAGPLTTLSLRPVFAFQRNAKTAAQGDSYVLFDTSAPHACTAVDKNGTPCIFKSI
ncbi:hypothetical protein P692DRAFT_20825047 [Suillus brevipes Sb2]|nr:hypothetical protein P692DRAFT_20825047 [Suillus brevipes Sb2]